MATKKTNADLNSSNILNNLNDVFSYTNPKKENKTTFEIIPISEIKLDPKDEFTHLFPLEEENIQNISANMKKKDFKKSQALTLITIEDENIEFLGDGHNRRIAALRAGIEEVPVYRETYPNRREAKIAMLELQINRRQLTDAVKMQTVALYRELLGNKKAENGTGKLSEKISEATGLSVRQVEKINTILDSDEEIKEEVLSGKSSINKSEKKAVAKKKEKTNYTNDNTSHLDALESSEGNPAPLIFITEHPREDPFKLTPEQDTERTAERKKAYDMGFIDGQSSGFEKALYFCLSQMIKGKSASEIYNDPQISDLSPSVIKDFKLDDDAEDIVLGLQERK